MHFSANCKARYCHRMSSVCLSVCPSLTLVNCDHIGWNSWKIISPFVSLGCSLFATPTWRVCCKGNTPKFRPKVTHPYWFERRRHSIANCGRIVTDSATVTMESLYETTIALSNGVIADSLWPPFLPKWGSICPQYTRMAISLQRVIRSTWCLVLGGVFGDVGYNGAISDSNKFKMAAAAMLDNFEWPYLRNSSRSTYRIARSSLR